MSSTSEAKTSLPVEEQGSPEAERLIRDVEGAAMLRCSKSTYWRLVAKGAIPPPIKIGGMSRWKVSDVQALIEQSAQGRFK